MSDAVKKIKNDFCSDVSSLGIFVTMLSWRDMGIISERKKHFNMANYY